MARRFELFRGKKINVKLREQLILEACQAFGSATMCEIVEELHEKKFMVDLVTVKYWVRHMVVQGRAAHGEKRDCTTNGRLAQTYITNAKMLEAHYARRNRRSITRTIETTEQRAFDFGC